MTRATDLFGLDRALTPDERRKLTRRGPVPKGHAWTPGTGPADETCGSCTHLSRITFAKTYLKCWRNRPAWTAGRASDIRSKDAACKFWEAP